MTSPLITPPAPHLVVDGIFKRFNLSPILKNVCFEVYPGEIIALLGPSGCGKSTLLNLIAGFITPDEGSIVLNGRNIIGLQPSARGTAMVFQSYALFPHLTVRKNITYGLDVRNSSKAEVSERLERMVDLFGLNDMLDRLPSELSGGQRQRVALARAVATEPEVLLLDEALSALDKSLRERMQIELAVLLRRLNITVIMVTHDQREAFSMADRVVVMNGGEIVQIGRPQDIYDHPSTKFVLEFVGGANVLSGAERRDVSGSWFETPFGLRVSCQDDQGSLRYVRVEDVEFALAPTAVHPANPGRIVHISFLGTVVRVVALFGETELVAEVVASRFADEITAGHAVFADFEPRKLRPVTADRD